MNLETKITIYKFTPQLFTLTHSIWNLDTSSAGSCTKFCEILCQVLLHALTISVKRFNIYFQK